MSKWNSSFNLNDFLGIHGPKDIIVSGEFRIIFTSRGTRDKAARVFKVKIKK